MTLRTLTFLRSRFELPAVSIFVAAHAVREGKWFPKIAVDVASGAADRGVLPQQRILGFRVVEREGRQQSLPSRCRVTILASLLKRTSMRVRMAIRAFSKSHVFESRRTASDIWLMALFAGHLNMHSRQRITRFRVVKLLRRFPVEYVVTPLAIAS